MIRLKNNGEPFTLNFDGDDFLVPCGKFNVTDELGLHIKFIANNWGKSVDLLETVKDEAIKKEKIEKVETIKEAEVKEETKKIKK